MAIQPTYCLANDLQGFGELHRTMAVRVNDIHDGFAFVTTSDVLWGGIPLVLRESQLSPIESEGLVKHKDGLVWF